MKTKILTLFIALTSFSFLQAQAPEAINYQAAVRNSGGEAIKSTNVGVQISIIADSINGNSVYTETFTSTTSSTGILNLQIGKGAVSSGVFSSIDWSATTYYVQLSLDIQGGTNYTTVGTTQLVSVPYALFSKTTGSCKAVTKTQRNLMKNIDAGTLIFCTNCGTSGELQIYNGTNWTNMTGGAIVE